MDEGTLLRRATGGDLEALEAVVSAWRVRIRRWALFELGDAGAADDAAQDTFVTLIRNIGRYDPDRPFGPWLRTVVRNCCHQVRRRQARHGHDALQDGHLTAVPDPEHDIDVHRATVRTIARFEALSPRQREIVHLCAEDGMTAADAARSLGIAASTARVLLHRARQTLLGALDEEAP